MALTRRPVFASVQPTLIEASLYSAAAAAGSQQRSASLSSHRSVQCGAAEWDAAILCAVIFLREPNVPPWDLWCDES